MPQPVAPSKTLPALPQPLTPFVGRQTELEEIARLLNDPACRLLTLVGPGGMGKTRLAIQIAHTQAENYGDGVFFVPLQSVQAIEFLAPAIADALDFPLSSQDAPVVQLLTYLHDKEILLVLDNFEQLLAEAGQGLLTDLLVSAPYLKLLVTSREVLNLQEEWLYHVPGMPVPANDQVNDVEAYSSVQFFSERARRVRRDFNLGRVQRDVVHICQLVEGVPLAIELAASWTKTLGVDRIAAEIQRNLDFLATNLRNVPDRQRSMRAVFDHSWQLLTEEEQSVFKRLSVFRGSFRRDAAEQIARATLPILSTLVDKSLLRLSADNRYQMHDLLRQYAAEHLIQSPKDVEHVYDRHCVYYMDFVYNRTEELDGGRQPEATLEIETELDNIRAAWQWAVELGRVKIIHKALRTMENFYQYQSRYLEGRNIFEQAARRLEASANTQLRELTLAQLLIHLSWFYIRLGQFDEARAAAERSLTLHTKHEIVPPAAIALDPRMPLAILAVIGGDFDEAIRLSEEARAGSEARGDKPNLSFAYYTLTSAALAQGNYQDAYHYAQQASELAGYPAAKRRHSIATSGIR